MMVLEPSPDGWSPLVPCRLVTRGWITGFWALCALPCCRTWSAGGRLGMRRVGRQVVHTALRDPPSRSATAATASLVDEPLARARAPAAARWRRHRPHRALRCPFEHHDVLAAWLHLVELRPRPHGKRAAPHLLVQLGQLAGDRDPTGGAEGGDQVGEGPSRPGGAPRRGRSFALPPPAPPAARSGPSPAGAGTPRTRSDRWAGPTRPARPRPRRARGRPVPGSPRRSPPAPAARPDRRSRASRHRSRPPPAPRGRDAAAPRPPATPRCGR